MVDVVKIHIFADVVSVAVGVAIIVAAAVDYVVDIIVADVIAIDEMKYMLLLLLLLMMMFEVSIRFFPDEQTRRGCYPRCSRPRSTRHPQDLGLQRRKFGNYKFVIQ